MRILPLAGVCLVAAPALLLLAQEEKVLKVDVDVVSLFFTVREKKGGLVYRAGTQTFNGTYTLGMGDGVTFNLTRELAGRKTHYEQCVIVEDRLTVSDSDGTKINFSKTR